MSRLEGEVAVITGAARGQGRSHALHMAAAGADIIALDICSDIASNPSPLATAADPDETRRLVEGTGRRIIAAEADVRDRSQLRDVLGGAVAELGEPQQVGQVKLSPDRAADPVEASTSSS